MIGPEPYDTKFLSPLENEPESKYAELAANQELSVPLNNGDHIHLSEIQSNIGNGKIKHSNWNDFPPIGNGGLCNSLNDLSIKRDLERNISDDNPRVSFNFIHH